MHHENAKYPPGVAHSKNTISIPDLKEASEI